MRVAGSMIGVDETIGYSLMTSKSPAVAAQEIWLVTPELISATPSTILLDFLCQNHPELNVASVNFPRTFGSSKIGL